MKVDFAFLADGAEAANGKMYVIGGGIDTLWVNKTPAVYPKLSFVLRLVLSPAEIGRKHAIEIQIMDEDGGNIAKLGGPLEIPQNPHLPKGWEPGFLSVLNFHNLAFPKIGDYAFHILVNNSSLKSVPLRIAQRAQMASA